MILKLYFSGQLSGLERGLEILSKELGFTLDPDGIPVQVTSENRIYTAFDGEKAVISYTRKHQFFRALSMLIPKLREGAPFTHEETELFTTNGAMFDASRNGVPSVEGVQFLLRKMALMGFNAAMLYTEDTYEVPEYPYFGYMRGRYTEAELRALDDYADSFGIELIPCIQTLGHLSQALKWREMSKFRDTPDVLLCDDEETYALLEKMIAAACRPFRSKRIHIGMDEAHSLGLGRYIQKNGFVPGFEIISRHLARVCGILKKHGLSPMIWSDMYFRLASRSDSYYTEKEIPQEVIALVPPEIQLVYWDYYNDKEEHYRHFMERHMQFHNPVLFAGGLWTWISPAMHNGEAFRNSIPALKQCHVCGVREVFCTLWGDNGAEADLRTALLAMQLYAEYGYSDAVTMDMVKERFSECVFAQAEDFLAISRMDVISQPPEDGLPPMEDSNFTKYLLYQDVLLGLFDKNFENVSFASHYEALEKQFALASQKNKGFGDIFRYYQALAGFLAVKADLGKRIYDAYHQKDKAALRSIAEQEIPEGLTRLQKVCETRRAVWFSGCKPFGFEVLDIRLGGVAARLRTARQRVLEYLDGEYLVLAELEQPRLSLLRYEKEDGGTAYRSENGWARIASACPI